MRAKVISRVLTAVAAVTLSTLSSTSVRADSITPTNFYLKYHQALLSADKVSDLFGYLCQKNIDQINSTPKDDAPKMFELMKMFAPKTVTITSEKVDGDKAVLTMTAPPEAGLDKSMSEKTEGTVTLIRDKDSWKIDKEKWNSKFFNKGDAPPADMPDTASPQPADAPAPSVPPENGGTPATDVPAAK